MIATLKNVVPAATLTDTLESLFAELDVHLAGTAAGQTDLVIDRLDQWKNPDLAAAGCFSEVTWSFVPNMPLQ